MQKNETVLDVPKITKEISGVKKVLAEVNAMQQQIILNNHKISSFFKTQNQAAQRNRTVGKNGNGKNHAASRQAVKS